MKRAARSCVARSSPPKRRTNGTKGGSRSIHATCNNEEPSTLVSEIVQGLHQRADEKTRQWFTNYVKGTCWIGCKTPVVREVVRKTMQHHGGDDSKHNNSNAKPNLPPENLINTSIQLIQCKECDAKLAGMVVLSEFLPVSDLATISVLQRLQNELLHPNNHLNDWSPADWFSMRVLRKFVFRGDHDLTQQVLHFSHDASHSLWHRRCGIVALLHYHKHRADLPEDIGTRLLLAIERNLLASPEERFTQTGCAWVLRYMLLQPPERETTLDMIVRHGNLWTTEAKKSLVEKLSSKDPRRKKILSLGHT